VTPYALHSSGVITPTPTVRSRKIGFSLRSSSYSTIPAGTFSSRNSTSSSHPSGKSAATPPGRMKLWFMRSPVTFSKKLTHNSRSRKP